MIFCGQCGFQLPPGTTRCPRCGTPVDSNITVAGETHTDDPTVASPSLRGQSSLPGMPPGQLSQHGTPFTPNNQQRLILRPGSGAPDYNTQQQAYDATSRVDAPNYPTNTPAYPGYGAQGVGNYQTQNVPPNHMPQSGGNYQTFNQSFAGIPQQGQYDAQQQAPRRNNRGRITGLVLILLGLIFILGSIVLFTTHRNNSNSGSTGGTGSQSASTQQAQAAIQQYYSDINKHDYTSAYAIWKNNPQSQTDFSRGFQNTLNDQLTINQAAQQADGTVKITVAVSATEKTASGSQQQKTYAGNYVLAQQTDTTWKIMSGTLTPV